MNKIFENIEDENLDIEYDTKLHTTIRFLHKQMQDLSRANQLLFSLLPDEMRGRI